MWMSDKPRTQQRLVGDLADLIDVLPDHNVLPFLQAFWKTMAREWNGINVLRLAFNREDHHREVKNTNRDRMDKYLLLVRAYIAASFKFLARHDWQPVMVNQYMDILSSIPLHITDSKIPDGMRYHLIDIYVDEMDRVDTPRAGKLPLDSLLEPLKTLKQKSPTKAVRLRVADALKDERLASWNDSSATKDIGEQGDESEGEWNGIED